VGKKISGEGATESDENTRICRLMSQRERKRREVPIVVIQRTEKPIPRSQKEKGKQQGEGGGSRNPCKKMGQNELSDERKRKSS